MRAGGLFYKSICMIMYAPVYACLCAFVCLCAGPKGRPAKNAIHFVLTPEQQQLKKPPVVGGNLLKAPLCKQQKNQKKRQ